MDSTIYKPSPTNAIRTVQLRLLQKEFNDTTGYIVSGISHLCIVPVKVIDVRFHKKSNEFFLLVDYGVLSVTTGIGVGSIRFHEFFTSHTEAEEHAVLRKIGGSEI